MILGSHVEQPHPGRPAVVHHFRHIDAAHVGELQQHLGTAFHVGARIDEHERPFVRGHQRRQGRTGYPLDPFDEEGRPHDKGAGAAGRDKGIPLPLRQQAEAHRHGAALVLLEDAFGLVVHRDDIRGVHDLHPVERHGVLRRHPADIRLVSRQENGVTVFRHRQGCSPQDFEGGVIPAVGVDDDPQMRFLSVCGFHGFATFLFIDPVQAGTGPGCPGHGGQGLARSRLSRTGSSRGGNIPKLAPMG